MWVFAYIFFIVLIFIWQLKKAKNGKLLKRKATVLYFTYTIAPIIIYGVLFFLLVGIEELLNIVIISEGFARSFLIIIIGGLIIAVVTSLIFSIVLQFLKKVK